MYSFVFATSQTQWQPPPSLRVPEIPDCSIGDIAVARAMPQPHIRFCPANAASINSMHPGAGHFYYVHEYGHIFGGPSEEQADAFAASELARLRGGIFFLNAMLSHLYYRAQMGEPGRPGYGTPSSRAARIRYAALQANNRLNVDEQTLLLYE